ncbi:MAG: acyl-CoA thioesterase [Bacteroidetes bacterium]|nr:MAG: acyl-CoA thioesterase [Bacteroidota bacterium]
MKLQSYRGAVMTWECDSNGHMNVMHYINKYELGGRNLIAEMGLSKNYMRDRNWGVAVLEQHVRYLQEVFEDDVLYIESCIKELSNKVFTFYHEMKHAMTHETVSTATIKLVLLDKEKRKAVPIPQDLREKFQPYVN